MKNWGKKQEQEKEEEKETAQNTKMIAPWGYMQTRTKLKNIYFESRRI